MGTSGRRLRAEWAVGVIPRLPRGTAARLRALTFRPSEPTWPRCVQETCARQRRFRLHHRRRRFGRLCPGQIGSLKIPDQRPTRRGRRQGPEPNDPDSQRGRQDLGKPEDHLAFPRSGPSDPRRSSNTGCAESTLGGSSSVNGMVYNRGSAADYDAMAALGNPGWSWRHILPVTAPSRTTNSAPIQCGSGGPLAISVNTLLPQTAATSSQPAKPGWSPTDDVNGGDTERIGPAPRTIKNGQRVSAAHAFLHPVTHRANLRVATDTTANRVLFEGDGVETTTSRWTASYTARREVILSLGSIRHRTSLNCPAWGRALLRGLGNRHHRG